MKDFCAGVYIEEPLMVYQVSFADAHRALLWKCIGICIQKCKTRMPEMYIKKPPMVYQISFADTCRVLLWKYVGIFCGNMGLVCQNTHQRTTHGGFTRCLPSITMCLIARCWHCRFVFQFEKKQKETLYLLLRR